MVWSLVHIMVTFIQKGLQSKAQAFIHPEQIKDRTLI